MLLKTLVMAISLTVMTAQAQADETRPFVCTTKLDYAIWKNGQREIKTIDLRVIGERTKKNTLGGRAVYVEAGKLSFLLGLPAVNLSEDIVSIQGTSAKEQATLKLVMLGNSKNSTNGASVSVRTADGFMLTAVNKDLSRADQASYPVSCEIEQF